MRLRIFPWLLIIVGTAWLSLWALGHRIDRIEKKESELNEDVVACPALWFDAIDDENKKRIEQVRALHDFIYKHYPGAEVWIGPRPPSIEYEQTPLRWKDNTVWIKRKPVYDRRFTARLLQTDS